MRSKTNDRGRVEQGAIDPGGKPRVGLTRRALLAGGLVAGAAGCAGVPALGASTIPIIDAHIHVFQGATPESAITPAGREITTFLPADFSALAAPVGIVGAIIVESVRGGDNDWYLGVAQANPMMLGVVGRLNAASPTVAADIARYSENPLFLGVRYSGFYTANAGGRPVLNPSGVEVLRRLADLDLVLDTFSTSIDHLRACLMLAEAIPSLRIVLDHQPRYDPAPADLAAYRALVADLAAPPNVYCKLSQVYHPGPDGAVQREYEPLREELEFLFEKFGENRVIFGSDYPNSYGVATIPESVSVMQRFYRSKSKVQSEKYFWRNSARVYKWGRRTATQPTPG